jgi:hypothetical protein
MSTQAVDVDAAEVLHHLEPGRRVADAMHDLWTKHTDGTWLFTSQGEIVVLNAENLLRVWGPVNVIPEGGI